MHSYDGWYFSLSGFFSIFSLSVLCFLSAPLGCNMNKQQTFASSGIQDLKIVGRESNAIKLNQMNQTKSSLVISDVKVNFKNKLLIRFCFSKYFCIRRSYTSNQNCAYFVLLFLPLWQIILQHRVAHTTAILSGIFSLAASRPCARQHDEWWQTWWMMAHWNLLLTHGKKFGKGI